MNEISTRRGRNTEDLSLLLGALGFVTGAVLALLVLRPPSALFGRGSIGEVAALAGGAVAGLAFLAVAMVNGPGIGYLNTTAFEIAAVGTVFLWLILFTRSVSAAATEVPEVSRAPREPERG